MAIPDGVTMLDYRQRVVHRRNKVARFNVSWSPQKQWASGRFFHGGE